MGSNGKGKRAIFKSSGFLAALLFALAIALDANAFTCGFSGAINSGYVTNGSLLNVTFGGEGINESLITAAVNCISSSTANSSVGLITNVSNGSGSAPNSINFTFINKYVLEDSNDYTCSVSCYNQTSQISGNSTKTGVIIDRTRPPTPTSISPSGSITVGSNTFSATVDGSATTGCQLWFQGTNPGYQAYSMTHTGSSCTLTFSSIGLSDYVYFIRATDGTNSTDTALTTISASNSNSGAGKRAYAAAVAAGGGADGTVTRNDVALAIGRDASSSSGGSSGEIADELRPWELAKTSGAAAAGFAIGAFAGTIALPGLGTVGLGAVGAIVGGIFGYMA